MPDRHARRAVIALVAGAVLGATGLLGGCAGQRPAPEAAGPAVGADAIVTARGPFRGESGRDARGHARVLRTGGQWVIELEPDFALDGAEEATVALGEGGMDPRAVLGPLRAPAGRQSYRLGAGLDIGDYTEVWIWSPRRGMPVAMAKLALT